LFNTIQTKFYLKTYYPEFENVEELASIFDYNNKIFNQIRNAL